MSKYYLGDAVFSGDITFSDGSTFHIEYKREVAKHGVSKHPVLKAALEDTVVRGLGSTHNWAEIQSIFHSTTFKDGQKVQDKNGLHVTVTAAQKLPDGSPTQREKCHIYIDGFNPINPPDQWYDDVTIRRVRWEVDRGSSQSKSSGSRASRSSKKSK